MTREGIVAARCMVRRLMKLQGLRGAARGKRIIIALSNRRVKRRNFLLLRSNPEKIAEHRPQKSVATIGKT